MDINKTSGKGENILAFENVYTNNNVIFYNINIART